MSDWAEVVAERRLACDACPPRTAPWVLQRFSSGDRFFPATLMRERLPFVVSGLALCPTPNNVPIEAFLRSVVGNRTVPVEPSGDLMTVAQVLDRIRDGELLYVYDVPIQRRLGALLDSWRLPGCFCRRDFLRRTRLPHPFVNWPTLFVGAPGTRSTTHVDRWNGHFWMFQVSGRKQWTIWPREEMRLLRPTFGDRFDPSFPPVEELVGCGNPVTLTLCPGDLLFVPGGSPHAVQNLEGNFVNATNVEDVLRDLSRTRLRYADDAALFEALSEVDFSEDEEDDEVGVVPIEAQ